HRFYVRWQEHKLMHQAQLALDKNDFRWATLAAQRAYSVDPSSVDACRTLSEIAERQGNIEAIEWRRRALALAPASRPDRLALAKTALRFSKPQIAAKTLAEAPVRQRDHADYQATAAHLALVQDDIPAAGKHLREAVRLAPDDPHRALELAEFQLRSGDGAQREAGRAAAQRLQENPQVQLDAFHILIDDALHHGDESTSVELAKKLEALPEATVDDRLLALGILRQFKDPGFTAALSRLEAESAGSGEQATKLINWMNSHGLALLAIDWSRQLPNDFLGNVAFRFALADAYVRLRDWAALRELLRRGSWDQAESLRLALEAKAARETGDTAGFEKNWAAAVARAGGESARLQALQTLAFQWNWPGKAVALLWKMADKEETEKEALQALYNYYAKERDTTGLYRTLTRLIDVVPGDLTVENNFAQISLLLKAGPERALALAREVHAKQPQNAAFASTYAFALYQKGDLPGALKVMSRLSPEQLRDPSVAAYYGVLLAAAGKKAEAMKFLDEAGKAALLPEEE
ncbi:MAG: tetratricopeptide repeat protein, partial [Rhodanobacteraceae bacterium]